LDPLLPALLTALAAEIGDKTQLLVILLAVRFGRPVPILAGVAVAALVNNVAAGYAGAIVHDLIGDRALALFVAVALISIAIGCYWPQRAEDTARDWKLGAFGTSAVAFLILEFGDKTQFATLAFAARADAPLLAGIGATIGIVAANVPAAILGPQLPRRLPVRGIRYGAGAIFLIVGAWTALGALLLI
jgi:putative Ca2+/H+ antiporter (TMEM165/GDT1 family)